MPHRERLADIRRALCVAALTSIQPPKLSVNLKFMIDGEMTDEVSCANDDLGESCLPKVRRRCQRRAT